MGCAPLGECLGAQFGAIVQPDRVRQAAKVAELFHDADHPCRRQRRVDLNRQPFSIALVNHIQRPKETAVVERVLHVIEGPDVVARRGSHQGVSDDRRQPPLHPPGSVQLQPAIHPPHTLVVPAVALIPEPVEAQPEPPSPVLGQRLV